jgi:exopolyphosphatase/pppGpp-phosphohydrolase
LLILNEAIKKFGCKTIFVSGYGVREGYFADRVLKEGNAANAEGSD